MRVNLPARAAAAEQRRARTRERLLDAAETVIAEIGVEAATIADIVRAAGVSRGAFYNYFPTTGDLIHALNQRVAAHMEGLLAEIAQRPVDPTRRLAASAHAMLCAYRSDPLRGWVAVQLASSRAPRQRSYEDVFRALYREGIRAGQFRDVDMTAAFTVCFGAMRMAQRDAVAGAAPAQAVQVVAMVLAAFGVPYDAAEQVSREEAVAARQG